MSKETYTAQEKFWAGDFGSEYICRNQASENVVFNVHLFARALRFTRNIRTCLEFGANVGHNLKALGILYPEMKFQGIEINKDAASELGRAIGHNNVFNQSILNWRPKEAVELVLVKGVLIHINPDKLMDIYQSLYEASSRYILVCEYYNPSPVELDYRGHSGQLFKRDFAGEMMNAFSNLQLVDYGFIYQGYSRSLKEDLHWFLMEKQ